jgi:ABC-type multidrug transport system fused ATPase/permease subunit
MDNNKNIYSDKLTNSANEALKDIMSEFKEKLLEQAYLKAKEKDTAEKEISLSDIMEAYSQLLEKKFYKQREEAKKKKFSFLVIFSGIIYALAGLIIYIFQIREFSIVNNLGITIAILGVFLALTGLFYQQLLNKKILSEQLFSFKGLASEFDSNEFELVKKWQAIEQLTSKLMIQKGYSDNEAKSFNSLIKFLSFVLNDIEKEKTVRNLLMTRNKILHESYTPDKNLKSDLTKKSNDIIDLLENKLEITMSNKG